MQKCEMWARTISCSRTEHGMSRLFILLLGSWCRKIFSFCSSVRMLSVWSMWEWRSYIKWFSGLDSNVWDGLLFVALVLRILVDHRNVNCWSRRTVKIVITKTLPRTKVKGNGAYWMDISKHSAVLFEKERAILEHAVIANSYFSWFVLSLLAPLDGIVYTSLLAGLDCI